MPTHHPRTCCHLLGLPSIASHLKITPLTKGHIGQEGPSIRNGPVNQTSDDEFDGRCNLGSVPMYCCGLTRETPCKVWLEHGRAACIPWGSEQLVSCISLLTLVLASIHWYLGSAVVTHVQGSIGKRDKKLASPLAGSQQHKQNNRKDGRQKYQLFSIPVSSLKNKDGTQLHSKHWTYQVNCHDSERKKNKNQKNILQRLYPTFKRSSFQEKELLAVELTKELECLLKLSSFTVFQIPTFQEKQSPFQILTSCCFLILGCQNLHPFNLFCTIQKVSDPFLSAFHCRMQT